MISSSYFVLHCRSVMNLASRSPTLTMSSRLTLLWSSSLLLHLLPRVLVATPPVQSAPHKIQTLASGPSLGLSRHRWRNVSEVRSMANSIEHVLYSESCTATDLWLQSFTFSPLEGGNLLARSVSTSLWKVPVERHYSQQSCSTNVTANGHVRQGTA
jgi:hypothetical protein